MAIKEFRDRSGRSWDATFQEMMTFQFSSPEMVNLKNQFKIPLEYEVHGDLGAGFTGFHNVCKRYFEKDRPPTQELIMEMIQKHETNCPAKTKR